VKDIDFWVDFVPENSNKLPKNGFGRKNKLSLQCVYTTGFRNFQFWKCEN